MSGFSIPLSGLLASSSALDVVGNNLANLNTTGFKGSTASFHDLVTELGTGSSVTGGGVAAPQATREFTQGAIQPTTGPFDAAISGNGFFVVKNAAGDSLYTRAGNFTVDNAGNLVTATGEFVQGYTAVNGVVNPSGAVGNINISTTSLLKPIATTQFTTSLNLNAAATTGEASGSFSTPVEIVDSLGAKHTVTVNFTKTDANSWSYDVTIPGEDLSSGKAGTPSSLAKGDIKFDANGQLTSPAPPGTVDVKITGLASGAADIDASWNLIGADGNGTITQYAQASGNSGTTQDGVAVAQPIGVSLSDGGNIVAKYSDGTQQIIAQVALASIGNPQSLVAVGNNNFEASATTIAPSLGASQTGDRGQIQGSSLESSTVDIAREFTNLIVFQRSYQANSRVITTLDELAQDVMNLKR